jgi:hypothetical protein
MSWHGTLCILHLYGFYSNGEIMELSLFSFGHILTVIGGYVILFIISWYMFFVYFRMENAQFWVFEKQITMGFHGRTGK